jgi:phage terminase Nu1 subunit (DNA packaging protein)
MANYNPNLVKIHRNYTFEELAAVFSVDKNTVSTWVKNGLPCLKEKRPFLILGADARFYLQKQRTG